MDSVYTIDEIKKIVIPIAQAHDVGRIYLFGSYARGEATPSSDIDLRVDKGNLKGLFALGALYADLEDGLGKKLDLLTTGSLDQKFLQHISKEEVLIYASQGQMFSPEIAGIRKKSLTHILTHTGLSPSGFGRFQWICKPAILLKTTLKA